MLLHGALLKRDEEYGCFKASIFCFCFFWCALTWGLELSDLLTPVPEAVLEGVQRAQLKTGGDELAEAPEHLQQGVDLVRLEHGVRRPVAPLAEREHGGAGG